MRSREHQRMDFAAHRLLELLRAGADEFLAGKLTPQSDHIRGLRILRREISAHGVDLSLDGIARDSPFGPALWNHRTYPHVLLNKQHGRVSRHSGRDLHGLCIKRIAVQYEMHRFCNNAAGKDCLELRSGF